MLFVQDAVRTCQDGPYRVLVVVAEQNQQRSGGPPLEQSVGQPRVRSGQVHGLGADLAGDASPQGVVAVDRDHLRRCAPHGLYDIGEGERDGGLELRGERQVCQPVALVVEQARDRVVVGPLLRAQDRDTGEVLEPGHDVALPLLKSVVGDRGRQEADDQGYPGPFGQFLQGRRVVLSEFSENFVVGIRTVSDRLHAAGRRRPLSRPG